VLRYRSRCRLEGIAAAGPGDLVQGQEEEIPAKASGIRQAPADVFIFRYIAAGGFGAVPPIVAARLAGATTFIHQQDVEPGLANRLLVPFARRITVSLASSGPHFPRGRTTVTGNPVREEVLSADPEKAYTRLGLEPRVPLVVVTGGGTGALGLKQMVAAAVPRLGEVCQVVHLTGAGRGVPTPLNSPAADAQFRSSSRPRDDGAVRATRQKRRPAARRR